MARAELGLFPCRAPPSELNLPVGFRFFPTDQELVLHYLSRKSPISASSSQHNEQRSKDGANEPTIIADVELYKFDPWNLPDRALFGEHDWYFFSPRDRKYPNGSRPNRAAGTGYWKATGADKPICIDISALAMADSAAGSQADTHAPWTTSRNVKEEKKRRKKDHQNTSIGKKKVVGIKKSLVFYKGKAPNGVKTNWIMHEYRLPDDGARPKQSQEAGVKRKASSLRLDDWVLCRIYKKRTANPAAAAAELDEPLPSAPTDAESPSCCVDNNDDDDGDNETTTIEEEEEEEEAANAADDAGILLPSKKTRTSAEPTLLGSSDSFGSSICISDQYASSYTDVAASSTSEQAEPLSHWTTSASRSNSININSTTQYASSSCTNSSSKQAELMLSHWATLPSYSNSNNTAHSSPDTSTSSYELATTSLYDDWQSPSMYLDMQSDALPASSSSSSSATAHDALVIRTTNTVDVLNAYHDVALPSPGFGHGHDFLSLLPSPSTFNIMDLGFPSPSSAYPASTSCSMHGLVDLDSFFPSLFP